MNYKSTIVRFIRTLVTTSLLLGVAGLLIYAYAPDKYYTPTFPFLLVFFLLATLIIFHYMYKAVEKRPMRFVNIFMLTTMLKLLAYMAVMVTYALLNREDARAFVITFFILYVIFTSVEVIALLRVNSEFMQKDDISNK